MTFEHEYLIYMYLLILYLLPAASNCYFLLLLKTSQILFNASLRTLRRKRWFQKGWYLLLYRIDYNSFVTHSDIFICMRSIERQLIVSRKETNIGQWSARKWTGRRRRAVLSVDTPIIACLANLLLRDDVPNIIGCLCAR